MNELVSVIMPAYNCAGTVLASVRTVLQQSYANLELIIVDDRSQDETATLLRSLVQADERVIVHTHAQNAGVAAARNSGLSLAKGEYIAFLDSDDLWHPEKLKLQIEFMRRESAFFTYTDYSIFTESDGSRQDVRWRHLPDALGYYDLLHRGHTIGTLSVVVARDFIGGARFQKIGHEDFALWLTLLRSRGVSARKVPSGGEFLAYYRLSANSLSSSKLRAARWMWNILLRHERLNFVHALYGFSRYAVRAVLRNA